MERKLKALLSPALIPLILVPLSYTGLHFLLDSSGGWILMAFYALIPLFHVLEGIFPLFKRTFHGMAVGILLILGVFLVGEIVVLPYQAYELWFELLPSGLVQGRVSHLFVKLGTLLIIMACRVAFRYDNIYSAFKNFLYLPLFFLFILFPSLPTALLFLASLLFSRIRRDNYRGVLVLFMILISVGLTGINTPKKGVPFIDNSPDRMVNWMIDTWPSLPLLYDVPLYGESFDHSVETGGRPALTDHSILQIEGPPGEQLYLRTGVAAQPGEGGDSLPLQNFASIADTNTANMSFFTVQVAADFINLIPYSENSEIMELDGKKYSLPTKSWSLKPDPPLFHGDMYTLYQEREEQVEMARPGFDFSPYLKQFHEPTEQFLTLAETFSGTDQWKTAEMIRDYLAENYLYTLETEESDTFTEDFLFLTGEGYCLHFATAFAALARAQGIPCRFAEGYLVIFPEQEGEEEEFGIFEERITVNVTGLSSHIWPEIYLEDRGWVSFEATAPFYLPESQISADDLTAQQLNSIQNSSEESEEKAGNGLPPLSYGAIPLVIGLIWGIIKLRDLMKLFGKHTLIVIRRFVRRAWRSGVERPNEIGWVDWGRRVTEELPETGRTMEAVMPLILKARYSPEPFEEKEKDELHRLYHEFKGISKGSGK
ncbi:MAG: transglutaminase-like domain-containing protein [Spirochaetales bacterium]|nr:transglutaminase-like domain-containing protein [Spirochaetales bacterium]